MKYINNNNAPKAIWPYSQAIKVWNFIYLSWQIWLDPINMNLLEWIENQTIQTCKNIWEIMKSEWVDYKNIFKTTIFLKDINNFEIVNNIYSEYFQHKPARSTIEVSNLPKWALIEIECIWLI